jgi:hypothetical protein
VATSVTTTGATPPAQNIQPTAEQLEVLRKIKLLMVNPCKNLGNPLEDKPSCGCGGTLAIKHACVIHGECRISARDKSLQNCIDCNNYQAREQQ